MPDESPLPSGLTIDAAPQVAVTDSAIAELPVEGAPKELSSISKSTTVSEEEQSKVHMVAELDSKYLPMGDSDKEVVMIR